MSADDHGFNTTLTEPLSIERRRPGPRVPINPVLIPLMRGQFSQDDSRDWFARRGPQPDIGRDPLSSARGLAFAILVCGTFWLGVITLF